MGWMEYLSLVDKFKSWRERPNLTVQFNHRKNIVIAEKQLSSAPDFEGRTVRTAYVNVRVANEGKSVAESCRGFLQRITVNGGENLLRQTVELAWNFDKSPPNLGPAPDSQNLDLLLVNDYENVFHLRIIDSNVPLYLVNTIENQKGRFLFQLSIRSQSGNAATNRSFSFDWHGDFDAIANETRRNGTFPVTPDYWE